MVNTRSFAVLGLLLSLGLIVFGYQVGKAVKTGREFDRYLSVRGVAEREVKATLVIWPIRFAVFSEELPALKTNIEDSKAKVMAYLASKGINTEEITFGLPKVTDRLSTTWSNSQTTAPRYQAEMSLVVRSADVDTVKTAMQSYDSLISDGVLLVTDYDSTDEEFIFDRLNDIKPDMIREATASARQAADKFAQDSKAKVGSIRKATQGIFQIESRDIATPELKVVRVVTNVDFFLQ